jgi:hypothetical protein
MQVRMKAKTAAAAAFCLLAAVTATTFVTGGAAMASPVAVSAQALGPSSAVHLAPPPSTSVTVSFSDVNDIYGSATIQGNDFTPGGNVELSFNDAGPGNGFGIDYTQANPGPACNPQFSSLLPCTTDPGYFSYSVPVVDCGSGDYFLVVAEDLSTGITKTDQIATPC